jgi:co-chaperonin GroES (HSP10)
MNSALAALREMNDPYIDRASCPIKPINWRLLIQPLPPKKKAGLLDMPDEVTQAEEFLTCVGKIIDMGSFAYMSKTNAGLDLSQESRKPAVGSFVLYAQYAGQEVTLVRDAQPLKLRIIDDTEVLAVITDPEMIKRYI